MCLTCVNCWHSNNWIRIDHLSSGTRVKNVGNANQNVSFHQLTSFHVENEIKGNKTMVDHTTSSSNVNPTDVPRNGIQNASVYRPTIFDVHSKARVVHKLFHLDRVGGGGSKFDNFT